MVGDGEENIARVRGGSNEVERNFRSAIERVLGRGT